MDKDASLAERLAHIDRAIQRKDIATAASLAQAALGPAQVTRLAGAAAQTAAGLW